MERLPRIPGTSVARASLHRVNVTLRTDIQGGSYTVADTERVIYFYLFNFIINVAGVEKYS